MNNLFINIHPNLLYYPQVHFDYQTGKCEISGESYMEETFKFYEPIVTWLRDYIAEGRTIDFNIKLTYFNTSSSRFILEIIDMLKAYKEKGGNVSVNWYYKEEDPDMLNEINDFMGETGMEINVIKFKN